MHTQLYFLHIIYQNHINMDDENDNGVNLQKVTYYW